MIIVNYHEISPGAGGHPYAMPREVFQQQIDGLIDHGFSFVTLTDGVRNSSEEHPRECAVTFDDGRRGAYEHGARILRERGIQATYFVCPDWLEGKSVPPAEGYSAFMTWDHVAELAEAGHVIGSHGKSHLPFFEIDAESAVHEVADSKRLIEQRLQAPCRHFASPWGHIDRAVMSLVRDCGYETLSSTIPGANKVPYELFRLRRLDASSYRSVRRFQRAMLSEIEAHSRYDAALVKVEGRGAHGEAMDRFDLAVCLDPDSYELAQAQGLPCIRYLESGGGASGPRQLVLERYGPIIRNRELTFTPLTIRGAQSAWTSLLSFLPGTSRRPSGTRSRISTRR